MMELKNYDQNEKAGVVAAAAMQDAMQSGAKFTAERPFPVGQEYDQEKMGVIPVCINLQILQHKVKELKKRQSIRLLPI